MKNNRFLTRALSLFLLLGILLTASACSPDRAHEYCELGIVLPRSFEEVSAEESFDLALSDGSIFVGLLRISLDAAVEAHIPTTMTPLKLAEYYRVESELADTAATDISEIATSGDVPYYTYLLGEDGNKLFYVPTFYVTPYAYFVITFISPSEISEVALSEILSYTSTVYMKI